VEVVEYLGDEQVVHLRFRDAEIVAKAPAEHVLEAGQSQSFSVRPEETIFFDADGGAALPQSS
jgi:ABC-type sugar transport system ATPase subunit